MRSTPARGARRGAGRSCATRRARRSGRHRPRRPDRPRLSRPTSSSTSRPPASAASRRGGAASASAPRRRSPSVASSELVAPYAAVARPPRLRGLAAPAQPGHRRRQPLPAHALLVLPRRRVALLARRRRHLLRADRRPPQAQPPARRLHLGPSLRPRARPRGLRRDGRRAVRRRRARLPLLELYRRPTDEPLALTLAAGELVTTVRLPAPPDASVYLRAGERQAFSFPLVSSPRPAATRASRWRAAGVANSRARSTRPTPWRACRAPAERLEADGARDARGAGDGCSGRVTPWPDAWL